MTPASHHWVFNGTARFPPCELAMIAFVCIQRRLQAHGKFMGRLAPWAAFAMCGITGYVSVQPTDTPSIIERMTHTIRHRGPDDFGYYRAAWAQLGFRRLAIMDVSGGHQPMGNEDDSLCIIFNGEIFNHSDRRPALEQAGHRYANRSDTETILHASEEYGPDCVRRLRGMFAFAIWDK